MDYTNSKLASYKKDAWDDVTMQKIIAVSCEMNKDEVDFVILFDGDIFFESKQAIDYCLDQMYEKPDLDLLAQHEWKNDGGKEICSGYYIISANKITRSEFSSEKIKTAKSNDQNFLNKAARHMKWEFLPVDKFPNGKAYYEKYSLNPWMIHFNFVFNKDKKRKWFDMKNGKYETSYLLLWINKKFTINVSISY